MFSFSKFQTCIQIKNIYKSEKETPYFYYKNNNKNRKHIKIKKIKKFLKKLKHEPSFKKLGNFTVAEGHGHPLVQIDTLTN